MLLAAPTESDRITGLLAFPIASIQKKRSRYDWFTDPVEPSGLLYEASVALQGLLIQLTDLSRMRERDPLVPQHKRPPSALGQAHLQASGATDLTIWDANPTPFQFGWRPNLLGM